nr:PREDICTED: uncharacterized protein LOC107779044 [Nicotiana tabacum]
MEAANAYTLPLDDTVNIESPTFGMENLDSPAKILDIPDCVENENSCLSNDSEEEVVLDSDDERMHCAELESVSKCRSSDDTRYTKRSDKWKLSPVSERTYVGCLRRSKKLLQHSDSARSTMDFDNTSQQKQFPEVNGRTSRQVDNIASSTKSRVEEDHYLWPGAEIFKDEIFEGNVETEALTGYALDKERVSSVNQEEGVDGDKEFPIHSCRIGVPKLSNTESQVPHVLSEANALDFVDHYLSVNNEDVLNEVKAGGVNKMISRPIFSHGGPQKLASRMNIQNAIKNSGVFDWPESQRDGTKSSFSRDRKILAYDRKNYRLKNKRVSSVQSSKEPVGSMEDLNKAEPKFLADGEAVNEVKAGGVNKIISSPILSRGGPQKLASRMNIQNAVKNLGVIDWPERQSDSANGSFSRHRKILTFDSKMSGLKKQKVSSVQSSEEPMGSMTGLNKAELKFLVEGHMNAEDSFLRKSDEQFDVGEFEQQFEGKRSDTLDTYDVGFDTQLAAEAMEILLHAPPLKCDTVCALQIPETSILKEGEFPESAFSREFNIDSNSSEPTECSSAETEQLRGKTRNFSSVVRRTRHQVSSNLRSPENQATNPNTESDFPKKRRKPHDLVELNDNLLKVAAVRGKVSKSGTDTSRKARKVNMQKQGEIRQSLAAMLSQAKLESWVSKGKRTHKGARRQSNGSSDLYPLQISADEDNNFKYPDLNHKAERRPQLLVFKRRIQSSSEKNHSGLLAIECTHEPCKYSVTSEKMMSMDFKRAESTETAKVNEVISISTNLLTNDMKFDITSSGNSNRSYSLNGDKKGRQHMRNLSRSTLTQELIRLGYAEKLPGFLPRGSRRRKGAGEIHVLFSQSLDSKLIKQQKKILARLGFISTSNCSDATHFVTDSFVRTRNMLEAIACGKPILTHLWLESCGRASCFVDEKSYILRDAKKEKKLGFNMPASLAHARKYPLLKGRRVIITPSVKPNRDTLLSLVKAVQGEVGDESNNKVTCDDLLILSCEEDYKVCIPYLKKGTLVYSSELLLNGIVIQKLEYNRNQLFTKFHDKNCKD